MAEELEQLWKKLSFTEDEDEGIVLGGNSTRTAKEVGKNCLVMKILTQRSINIEALRKTMRMVWRTNKLVQISEIEEDLFLVEFGDPKDKKKVLEMCPWSFEKNLVLLQEFSGDLVPKEIDLKWSPFWVQVSNLPLKSRTKETGMVLGSKLGKAIDVDVPENGVHWGRYLRVKVQLDVTKKLIQAKKVSIEDDEPRWVFFRYERLPNFCYVCGLIGHSERECSELKGSSEGLEKEKYQYGAWLRAEPVKRSSFNQEKFYEKPIDNSQAKVGLRWEGEATHQPAPHVTQPTFSNTMSVQQKGVVAETNTSHPSKTKQSEKLNVQEPDIVTMESNPSTVGLKFQEEEVAHQLETLISGHFPEESKKVSDGLGKADNLQAPPITHGPANETRSDGPIAMVYDCEVGWVPEAPGPNQVYWKRIKRDKTTVGPTIKFDPIGKKRQSPSLTQEVDPNVPHSKKLKEGKQSVKFQKDEACENNTNVDGGVVVAAMQPHRAQ